MRTLNKNILRDFRNWISAFSLVGILIFALHVIMKVSDNISDTAVIFAIIVGLPVSISLTASIFKKSLFHPLLWICTVLLMCFFVIYTKYFKDENRINYLSDSCIVQEYFGANAGFFTRFSPIIMFNQDFDSIGGSKEDVMKCLYRLGSNRPENYYIGKIKIENDRVSKVYYDKRIVDDIPLAKLEFGERLKAINQLRPIIDSIILPSLDSIK